jgi:hypothetical protein
VEKLKALPFFVTIVPVGANEKRLCSGSVAVSYWLSQNPIFRIVFWITFVIIQVEPVIDNQIAHVIEVSPLRYQTKPLVVLFKAVSCAMMISHRAIPRFCRRLPEILVLEIFEDYCFYKTLTCRARALSGSVPSHAQRLRRGWGFCEFEFHCLAGAYLVYPWLFPEE